MDNPDLCLRIIQVQFDMKKTLVVILMAVAYLAIFILGACPYIALTDKTRKHMMETNF